MFQPSDWNMAHRTAFITNGTTPYKLHSTHPHPERLSLHTHTTFHTSPTMHITRRHSHPNAARSVDRTAQGHHASHATSATLHLILVAWYVRHHASHHTPHITHRTSLFPQHITSHIARHHISQPAHHLQTALHFRQCTPRIAHRGRSHATGHTSQFTMAPRASHVRFTAGPPNFDVVVFFVVAAGPLQMHSRAASRALCLI